MGPLIGITAYPREVDIVPVRTVLHTISGSYVDAVVRAGGVPVVLPVLAPALAAGVVARVDGLLLPGGGDVAPASYGAVAEPETHGVDGPRDAWELAVASAALGRGVPVLAVCRGAQLLNVALGGSLVQHVPGHACAARYQELVHTLSVSGGSRLAGVLGGTSVGANSLHHQAVGRPGERVRPVAWAEDGTVEGFEMDGHPHVLAVQWHPELLGPPHDALFADLVAAAAVRERAV
ncbi:MAG TPA: gamma-glutamyl-gamma-aminobutyrate hydrolase family protein [Acidimicrobiales bacterium]|nr:gamma-glutamyl-gamma-aminobutyrate hydrolase family protein [Acidimicrobiales bacterium]